MTNPTQVNIHTLTYKEKGVPKHITEKSAAGTSVYADVGKIMPLEGTPHPIGKTCKSGWADYKDVHSDIHNSEWE